MLVATKQVHLIMAGTKLLCSNNKDSQHGRTRTHVVDYRDDVIARLRMSENNDHAVAWSLSSGRLQNMKKKDRSEKSSGKGAKGHHVRS